MTLGAIPQPKRKFLTGNLGELDADAGMLSLMRLSREYGPIYRLSFPGDRNVIFVSAQELVNELCDESRFDKRVHSSLGHIRDFAGDGLFTAHTQEPNWGKAHRILMPAFGPLAIREMFPEMSDVAEQLLLKWERFGENAVINVTDDMTRLTLDTIALCGFDTRFNSFYQNELHPFVGAMVDALEEAGARGSRLPLQTQLMLRTKGRYAGDVRLMNETVDAIIAERKADPTAGEKNDLLARMIKGRDPETGEGLSDENIRYQLVTFLIAGHETTSGLLSFTLYQLLKHPEMLALAQAEVDEVLAGQPLKVTDLPKLSYLEQVLKESLRLWPTAPAFGVYPHETTLLGGRYEVTPEDTLLVLLPSLHRDPQVWADPERFDPERFSPEAEAALPENAYKPFGNGQRACIGRPFALQEATLVLASVLQRFNLSMADPSYELEIKETLTLKPGGFGIRAKRRSDVRLAPRGAGDVLGIEQRSAKGLSASRLQGATKSQVSTASGGVPLLLLYGSESGSSEAFTQRIASDALAQGYTARISTLDEASGSLPEEGAVVIVTASYEGKPPANARKFVAWAESLQPGALSGVRYTVLGCGNRDWVRTYQRIPTLIDERLGAAGATRVKARGEADASGDFFGDFESWYEGLWPALGQALGQEVREGPSSKLAVEVLRGTRARILRQDDLRLGEIVENRELVDMTSPLARSKKHLEIRLPEGMTYRCGDYLSVLPTNPEEVVLRTLGRFNLGAEDQVIIHSAAGSQTALPTEQPVGVRELLLSYVELLQPATRGQLETLIAATRCPPEKKGLEGLLTDYDVAVLSRRVSVLELLERFGGCELSFADFLSMLPPLRPRQYSISSSPLWRADHCTLTVAVVDAPALSGQGQYRGVASSFLAQAQPGTRVPVGVRPSTTAFHPPQSLQRPLIMVCAGSGIAPFHGFLQERAALRASGQDVGPALLFFGCDHPDVDYLYRDELSAWEAEGVVSLRPAFSEGPDGDVRFVQHRLWQDRAEVERLFRQDARIFVCGDGRRMAPAVRETFVRIYEEATGSSAAVASAWADALERTSTRYVADVFA